MSTTALVWFRRDLRVHDHPGLTAAHRECDRVVPVVVLDPRLLAGRFPSPNRAWFLHGCLAELRAVPAARLAEPWTMSAEEQAAAGCAIGTDYPAPVVDHKVERERAMARYRAVGAGR